MGLCQVIGVEVLPLKTIGGSAATHMERRRRVRLGGGFHVCLLCFILSCVRRFLCFWVSKIGGVLSGPFYCSTVEGLCVLVLLFFSGKFLSSTVRTVQKWWHIG